MSEAAALQDPYRSALCGWLPLFSRVLFVVSKYYIRLNSFPSFSFPACSPWLASLHASSPSAQWHAVCVSLWALRRFSTSRCRRVDSLWSKGCPLCPLWILCRRVVACFEQTVSSTRRTGLSSRLNEHINNKRGNGDHVRNVKQQERLSDSSPVKNKIPIHSLDLRFQNIQFLLNSPLHPPFLINAASHLPCL